MCLLQLVEHAWRGVINVVGMREHGCENEWALLLYFSQRALPFLSGSFDERFWQQS